MKFEVRGSKFRKPRTSDLELRTSNPPPSRPSSPSRVSRAAILRGVLAPGVVVCHYVFSGVQEDFHGLLERKTSDWDLPEEQFLQCPGRSGHTILLLNGIDRYFSAVAKMTGYQGQRPGHQTVDQIADGDILPKPMLPESIQARH